MINKIGVENRSINSIRSLTHQEGQDKKNPSFKAGGPWGALLLGIQECEKNPMVNVAVIDMFSAILPRTFVESMTNGFAGFEAFRREASGLIVNCLIPGFIAWGAAIGLNRFIMPKGTNISACWADGSLIKRATETYKNSNANDKIFDSLKNILSNTSGYDGDKKIIFSEALTEKEITDYSKKLNELVKSNKSRKQVEKEIKEIAKTIAEKTHVYENIKVVGKGEQVSASTIATLLNDTTKYYKEIYKGGSSLNIDNFAKQSKKLVKAKSLLGMAIVLPLAASMQYINRMITEKVSGVKGAPIYDDFGSEQNEEVKQKAKEGLLKQKIISISSMIGVALLSMMKKPSWNMFEFKGQFPTMDQARIISTTTFASRMAVADDKNELAEATVRDIATFSGLYFLGDYAGKATATAIEKKTGVKLLNDTKPEKKGLWHWIKDVSIKSSEEVISKTAEDLKAKGITPNAEQKTTIQKELKRAVNLRSACQVANLGVSLILLGLIIPIFTRNNTKKRHAEDLRLAQEHSQLVGIRDNTEREQQVDFVSTKNTD